MRQAIIFFTLISCFCGFAMARCLQKGELERLLQECLENASPGITNDVEKKNEVLKAMANYKNDGTDDYSDPIIQVAAKVKLCAGTKTLEIFPESKQIWLDCDTKTNSQREKTIECMADEIEQMCPQLKEDRSKRSPFSHVDLFVWAAEPQKQQNNFQLRNSELLAD